MTRPRLPSGELFGIEVLVDDDVAPGIVEIHPESGVSRETAIPALPVWWGLADNGARLAWLIQNAAVFIVVGEGTTEEMMTLTWREESA